MLMNHLAGLRLSEFVANSLFYETQHPNWVTQTGTNLAEKLGFEKSGFDTKHQSGFDTAVLTHENQCQPTAGKGLFTPEIGQKVRFLLISNESNEMKHPLPCNLLSEARLVQTSSNAKTLPADKKRKTNRKTKIDDSHFLFEGSYYEINNLSKSGKPYGIFRELMHRLIEQLNNAYAIHGKVFVFRFDLSCKQFTYTNKAITNFIKTFKQKLQREYLLKDIGFIWVREHERSSAKQQHYHLAFFLDGQKVWFHQGITKIVKEIVTRSKDFSRAHFAGLHQVADAQGFQDAVYHCSYLAKSRGKGYRPEQTKDYGSSRIKLTTR